MSETQTTPAETTRPEVAAHSFATALCGFVGSTLAATVVLVLLGSV